MPGVSQRRFHATIQGPSAEALEILGEHGSDILAAWGRELQTLNLAPADLLMGSRLDFNELADCLRKNDYPAFRQQIQLWGEKLARAGIQLDCAISGFNRLYEACLPPLMHALSKRAAPILALARLHALVGLLILSGYKGLWGAGKKSLVEASLSEGEDRRRGASAYVTRIYEQERNRLSRDLHDEVGHDLILIKLYLEMIAMDARKKATQQIQPRLDEAIALVTHALDSVRRLVLDLGPAVFDDLGFLPAVRSYASQFSSRTHIDVRLQEGYLPVEIPLSHQVALYRLLQGALSNVLKHASASKVNVSLSSKNGSTIIMSIEDDGVGFDPEAMPGKQSFGLTAMRERTEVLGGEFRIESYSAGAAGSRHGTRIEVEIPLPDKQS